MVFIGSEIGGKSLTSAMSSTYKQSYPQDGLVRFCNALILLSPWPSALVDNGNMRRELSRVLVVLGHTTEIGVGYRSLSLRSTCICEGH